MKTKLAIIALAVTGLVWVGATLGRWATAEAAATETRYAAAMKTLSE